METDLGGRWRWIGGAALAAQLVACGGKAIGCPSDALDCTDDSNDPGQGGSAAQTASTGVGGSLGLGGTGQGPGAQSSSGQGGSAQSGNGAPASASNGAGGSFGSGTTGEGNVTPTGFAGAASSNNGASSGAAGFSGSSGTPSSGPATATAPPCPAVQPPSVTPRPACVAPSPVFPMGPSCTENWCNRPSVPSVVNCNAVEPTLGDAYHYIVNGDSYDATFSFDFDRSHSGAYPNQGTFLSVRLDVDVGVTDHGTRITERIEVPAALALARGLAFIDHTIVGTLVLRASDLDQSQFERPIYHAGCDPVLDRSGLPTPGPCACGFAGIPLDIPIYARLSRIP